MRFCILHGSGSQWICSLLHSLECTCSLLRSCRLATCEEIQPTWTWFPVDTNSLLSLWPQVTAVTGHYSMNTDGIKKIALIGVFFTSNT